MCRKRWCTHPKMRQSVRFFSALERLGLKNADHQIRSVRDLFLIPIFVSRVNVGNALETCVPWEKQAFFTKNRDFRLFGWFFWATYPAMWTGKRDSGVLELGLDRTGALLWEKTTQKARHYVVFCDHSGVLASLRGVTIDLVSFRSFSLINYTS